METKKLLTPEQSEELLKILHIRFTGNMHRHKGLEWNKIQTRIQKNPVKLWSLKKM